MGLRLFLRKLKTSDPESPLPPFVTVPAPNGASLEVPTEALGGPSASFCSHKVVLNRPDQLEVKTTIFLNLFFLLFAILGLCFGTFVLLDMFRSPDKSATEWFGLSIGLAVCVLFCGLALAGFTGWFGAARAVLDRRIGLYWKNRMPKAIRKWCPATLPLETILAVQVCSKRVSDSDRYFVTYEINLVLSDPPGERICLMSHGNKKAILRDAQITADFLRQPLLDHAWL